MLQILWSNLITDFFPNRKISMPTANWQIIGHALLSTTSHTLLSHQTVWCSGPDMPEVWYLTPNIGVRFFLKFTSGNCQLVNSNSGKSLLITRNPFESYPWPDWQSWVAYIPHFRLILSNILRNIWETCEKHMGKKEFCRKKFFRKKSL